MFVVEVSANGELTALATMDAGCNNVLDMREGTMLLVFAVRGANARVAVAVSASVKDFEANFIVLWFLFLLRF